MQIRPKPEGTVNPTADPRANKAGNVPTSPMAKTGCGPGTSGAEGTDKIDISEKGRQLFEAGMAHPDPSPDTLPPDRRQLITQRIAQGWYDSPEARSQTLRMIADDLGAESQA